MKNYSVPADFKKSSVERWAELNRTSKQSRVYQTYGQITERYAYGSGRAYHLLPQLSLQQLKDYISYCMQYQISFAYTLNTSCVGNCEFDTEYRRQLFEFLKELWSIGVKTLIVSMPSLIEIIQSFDLGFTITVSAISRIDCAYKAKFYKNLCVDKMVLDPDVVRDFSKIRRIVAAFGDGVELIVNNSCRLYCPYKVFHYNHESHAIASVQGRVSDYYYTRCTCMKHEDGAAHLRLGWIRPEDISLYSGLNIQYFKIQGRQECENGDIFNTVKAYFDESYEGNLSDLLNNSFAYNHFVPNIPNQSLEGFINPFYDGYLKCNGDCKSCNYCETYAKEHLNYVDLRELSHYTIQYYKDCDVFTNLLSQEKNIDE